MTSLITVAIVGAGPAGLVSARWALHYGMLPTIFESANTVGGVWRLGAEQLDEETTAVTIKWPSNKTSISRYSCQFQGLTHDKDIGLFATREEMGAYLKRYAEKFGLLPHVRFGHRIVAADPIDEDLTETRWRIRSENSQKEERCEEFDRLIMATGYCTRPFIPECYRKLLDDKSCAFKGRVYHTPTTAPTERAAYSDQNVVLVGSSYSSLDILALIAGSDADDAGVSARKITILRVRPFWIVPSNVPFNVSANKTPDNGFKQSFPFDFVNFRRCMRHSQEEVLLPTQEWLERAHHFFESLLPGQKSITGGKFALKPEVNYKQSVCFSIVNNEFAELVERIGPQIDVFEKDPVVEFEERSLRLTSGASVPCDVLVFGTGFKTCLQELLPPRVLEALEFRDEKSLHRVILHKSTLHPQLHTISFVGMNENLLFMHLELQARWTAAVFSKRQPPPDPLDPNVQRYQNDLRTARELPSDIRPFLPHSDYVGFADELAREVGAMPDLSRLRNEEPELYSLLYNAPVFGAHYFLEGPDADRDAALDVIKSFSKEFSSFPIDNNHPSE